MHPIHPSSPGTASTTYEAAVLDIHSPLTHGCSPPNGTYRRLARLHGTELVADDPGDIVVSVSSEVTVAESTDHAEAPRWFRQAIAQQPELGSTTVRGCRIVFRAWGTAGRRGVILVHGGAALSAWWDHVAPMLASEYRVVALDLSGHGDSGRRDAYDQDAWADETLAVSSAAGIDGQPVAVGHSMGGWVALNAAAIHRDQFAGVIVVDSPVRERSPEEQAAAEERAFGPLRVYPDREAARARFRTMPEQPTCLSYVMEHIAGESMRRIGSGWTWKFDPAIFSHPRPSPPQMLPSITCRVAILRAELGLLTPDVGAHMYDLLGRVAPVIAIPEAGHHVMIDQPLLLVTAVRALLADWEHSTPLAHPADRPGRGLSPAPAAEPLTQSPTQPLDGPT